MRQLRKNYYPYLNTSPKHKTLLHLSCVFVVCSPRHLEDTPNGTCVLGLRRLLFCWLVFITRWLSRLSCFIIRGSEHMAKRSETAARWFQTRVGESETFLNKIKKRCHFQSKTKRCKQTTSNESWGKYVGTYFSSVIFREKTWFHA